MNDQSDKPYFENLDALRFFAFLSVFLSHGITYFNYSFSNRYIELLHIHFFYNGNLGVSFFFVLSGFLITWLLLIEKNKATKINVLNFYMRRVLRIWPVYFIIVIIGFVLGTGFDLELLNKNHFPYHINISQLPWYLTFLANFDLIINDLNSIILSILWSVSVEEQFYLVWPLVLLILAQKKLPFTCYIIILISFIARCNHSEGMNFSTLEVMSELAVGGLIAYYCLNSSTFLDYFKKLRRKKIIIVYILFLMSVPLRGFSHIFGEKIAVIYYPFESLIFSFFFGFIILEQCFSENSFYKIGKIKILGNLGKISYGLYAYHILTFPVVYLIMDKMEFSADSAFAYVFELSIALTLTIIVSFLSYTYFEKKILHFKKNFEPN